MPYGKPPPREFVAVAFRPIRGNYVLKNLDSHGQRIAIKTTINEISFYSGWILCPEGKIKNTTPSGGWVK